MSCPCYGHGNWFLSILLLLVVHVTNYDHDVYKHWPIGPWEIWIKYDISNFQANFSDQ